ncbi:hypothetical protein [Leptolyngbya phage Lbo-JY46]
MNLYKYKELVVNEDELNDSKKLLERLKNYGINIGSGHDGFDKRKIQNIIEVTFTTYCGGPVYNFKFTKIW